MKSIITALAATWLVAACMPMAELAYDLRLESEREACNKAPDMNAQRACKDRVRAAEKEAQKVRSGN